MHCSATCCLLRVGTNYFSSWHLYSLHRSPSESPSAPAHIRENDAPQTDIWSSKKTNELLTCARKQTELLPRAHKTISPSLACAEGASATHTFVSCTTIFHRLCSVRLLSGWIIPTEWICKSKQCESLTRVLWSNFETLTQGSRRKANSVTSNPADSHICKFIQIVVNLWAAHVQKGESWDKNNLLSQHLRHEFLLDFQKILGTLMNHSCHCCSFKTLFLIRFFLFKKSSLFGDL